MPSGSRRQTVAIKREGGFRKITASANAPWLQLWREPGSESTLTKLLQQLHAPVPVPYLGMDAEICILLLWFSVLTATLQYQ